MHFYDEFYGARLARFYASGYFKSKLIVLGFKLAIKGSEAKLSENYIVYSTKGKFCQKMHDFLETLNNIFWKIVAQLEKWILEVNSKQSLGWCNFRMVT